MIATVNQWYAEAQDAYRQYNFHLIVHSLINLVTTQLSSRYLDVVKDRLYTLAPHDALRRETQAVLYYTMQILVRAVAPILVFTSEEIYQLAPKPADAPSSVHLSTWWPRWEIGYSEEEQQRLQRLFSYRDMALKALEELRAQKLIGNSLQGEVHFVLPSSEPDLTQADAQLLQELALCARVSWQRGDGFNVQAQPTTWPRCERCWRYTEDVGHDRHHPDVCRRCADVLSEAGL
ncbi:MAG: class I tRNA ligase family protein [Firmicutes bacterium]|nr:class I tRNA ligase family protein [Bacillota bacterium]